MMQQQQQQHGNTNGHGYTNSDGDDASSVGSLPHGGLAGSGGVRERSGSVLSAGSGSGYGGSPPHGGNGGTSPVVGYELTGNAGAAGEQFSAARRWGRDVVDMGVHPGHAHHGGHHGHHGMGVGMLASPISAGGHGGGGGGFAMMM
jgi:hypothetical protein